MTKDLTIIGAGPVGLFGAFYAGLRGLSVRLIDSLDQPGGQLNALYPEKFVYDMPGFPEILAKDLAENLVAQAGRFDPEYVLSTQCSTLRKEGENWILGTDNGEFSSRAVIICAGVGAFNPTRIGVEREDEFEGKGLTYGVRDKQSFRGKNVVVVGGGDSAMDWALALQPIANKVTLVHRRDKFVAHEKTIQQVYASGIEVRVWEVVTELIGESHLKSVKVHNRNDDVENEIDCEALVVCIGFKTSLGPLKEWGLEFAKTKIVVNERQETNLPGVYAAGDVCTHGGKLDLIATGVGEVATAVNFAKVQMDPTAKAFPGHSSDMELPSLH